MLLLFLAFGFIIWLEGRKNLPTNPCSELNAMILSKAFSHSRTSDFCAQFFKPRYEAFQQTVMQTPLVIMLWGPRQRTRLWTAKRHQIRDTLRRMGHSVFFSEQLGVSVAAITKKGVEFLQSETADLIIALQSSYDVVGAIQHFSEFRVVEAKMFLFVDAAAPDERLYHRALDDLRAGYNNVETFKFPEDVAQDNLIIKIVDKVHLIQMTKYCAIQKVGGWRLSMDGLSTPRARSDALVQPFRYNLLELYRDHRDEIDVLSDSAVLFVLAYANYAGYITIKALAHQVGLDEAMLRTSIAPLLRGQMLEQINDGVSVTGFGRRVLEGADLMATAAPVTQPRKQALQLPRLAWSVPRFAMALAGLLLFFALTFYWLTTSQTQLPLQYTPTRPAATQTATPTPPVIPSPTVRR